MTITFGIIIFSIVGVFVISLLVFVFIRALDGGKKKNYWLMLFFTAVVFVATFSFSRLYVCSEAYAEKLWKGKADQRAVKEVLVQDVPELNGVDLKEITFDLSGDQAIAIHGSNTISLDGETAEYVKAYFNMYHTYEYETTVKEQTLVLSLVLACVMTLAITYVIEIIKLYFAVKHRAMERLL